MMNRIDSSRLTLVALPILAIAFLSVGTGWAGFRFPHATHQEMELECVFCHERVPESQSRQESLLPSKAICHDCHDDEFLSFYDWTEESSGPSGFQSYSHKAHLAMEGNTCLRCHGALSDPALAGTGDGELGHDLCWTCHDGKRAGQECSSCHADVGRIRPLDHQVDYLHTHQYSARASGGGCEGCHRESELCSDCHQGENVLLLTHDRNFLFTHAQEARKHDYDCASCHDTQSFCVDCHGNEGITPSNHDPRGAWMLRLHATEARRDITYCVTCHPDDGEDCRPCHGEFEE